MKHTTTEEITVKRTKLVNVTCDMCGLVVSGDYGDTEIYTVEFTCGYDSTLFGDLSTVRFDLCEPCMYNQVVQKLKNQDVIKPNYDV